MQPGRQRRRSGLPMGGGNGVDGGRRSKGMAATKANGATVCCALPGGHDHAYPSTPCAHHPASPGCMAAEPVRHLPCLARTPRVRCLCRTLCPAAGALHRLRPAPCPASGHAPEGMRCGTCLRTPGAEALRGGRGLRLPLGGHRGAIQVPGRPRMGATLARLLHARPGPNH
jgi:hypothetical protein